MSLSDNSTSAKDFIKALINSEKWRPKQQYNHIKEKMVDSEERHTLVELKGEVATIWEDCESTNGPITYLHLTDTKWWFDPLFIEFDESPDPHLFGLIDFMNGLGLVRDLDREK